MLDLSNLQDGKQIIRPSRLRSNLRKPLGLLAGFANTHSSRPIMKETKEHAKAIRHLIKAFALVGTGNMVGLLVGAVSKLSGMTIATFETWGEAMDWLAREMSSK